MKTHTENPSGKPSIDDLFARKLGTMSLPPGPDGFERLQARMGKSQRQGPVVFWRNPSVQRYMAAAACLVVVCLFGWLYRSSDKKHTSGEQVAANEPVGKPSHTSKKTIDLGEPTVNQNVDADQLAKIETVGNSTGAVKQIGNRPAPTNSHSHRVATASSDESTLALVTTKKEAISRETPDLTKPNPNATPQSEQVAVNPARPVPVAERVLVVTIAEPAALAVARQATNNALEEKPVVANVDNLEKESRLGGLWQQVKRVKQGEIFARRDISDDERGLLGRAYNGLKHTLEKDKPAKQ